MSFSNGVFSRLLAMPSFIRNRCLNMEPLEDRRLLAFEVEVESMFVVPPTAQLLDLVPLGADWKYLDDGSDQSSHWRQPADDFNDDAWASGAAPLGYGEDDEATVINCGPNAPLCNQDNTPTYYFRHTFEVPELDQLSSNLLAMLLRSDLGTAVFVNGVPVYRDFFLAEDATFEDFGQPSSLASNSSYFWLPRSLLQAGSNTVAVEVHRSSVMARDVSFDFELRSSTIADNTWNVEVNFTGPVRDDSLQADDLVINGQSAVDVRKVSDRTVWFAMPASAVTPVIRAQLDEDSVLEDTPQGTPARPFQTALPLNTTAQYFVNQQPRLQLGNAPLWPFPGSETDQVELLWQTVPAGTGETDQFVVEYRRADSTAAWRSGTVGEPLETGVEGRVVWSAPITGLEYDTAYEYRVRHLRGSVVLQTYQDEFRTRLSAESDKPFEFAAYGDSAFISGIVGFRDVHRRLLESDMAFSVLLGDTAYERGSHANYDARFDGRLAPEVAQWAASRIDYLGVGNHELFTDNAQPTRDNFSVPILRAGESAASQPPADEPLEHNYSFDYGNVHFVTFDTNSLRDAERLESLLAWVSDDLAASTARWKIVFGHHSIAFTPDKLESPLDNYYQRVVQTLNDSGADIFLVSHSHTFNWTKPLLGQVNGEATFIPDDDKTYDKGAGIIQVVAGVGGRSLRPGLFTDPAVAAGFSQSTSPRSQYGFARFEVQPDEMRVSYVGAWDGSEIDSLKIVARQGPSARVSQVLPASGLQAVDQLFVEFSEPVFAFGAGDLTLLRNGTRVGIPSTVVFQSEDNIRWSVSGLSEGTAQPGSYTFLVSAEGDLSNSSGEGLAKPTAAAWFNARHAGDANGDGQFNQADLVSLLRSGMYRSAESANWSQGDWNGDGFFDALDIILALQTGDYLQGPYFNP